MSLNTPAAERIAVAQHSYGLDRYTGAWKPFTRLTRERRWIDGGSFIANIDGHLTGETAEVNGHEYRLNFAPMDETDALIAARSEVPALAVAA